METWKSRARSGRPRRSRRAPAIRAGSRLIVMLLEIENKDFVQLLWSRIKNIKL